MNKIKIILLIIFLAIINPIYGEENSTENNLPASTVILGKDYGNIKESVLAIGLSLSERDRADYSFGEIEEKLLIEKINTNNISVMIDPNKKYLRIKLIEGIGKTFDSDKNGKNDTFIWYEFKSRGKINLFLKYRSENIIEKTKKKDEEVNEIAIPQIKSEIVWNTDDNGNNISKLILRENPLSEKKEEKESMISKIFAPTNILSFGFGLIGIILILIFLK